MQNFAIYDFFGHHQSHVVSFQFTPCMCVYRGSEGQQLELDHLYWASVSMRPATGASEHMQASVGSLADIKQDSLVRRSSGLGATLGQVYPSSYWSIC